ncbi:SynChlorMet cassette protein ScmC [candidate division KSB1 bacterium]|nr:SynChlorMet cassette protein ScmC [candidate division KSB1 bacterium]
MLARPDYNLFLHDSTPWLVCSEDDNALPVVTALAETMRLQPGSIGRRLLVRADRDQKPLARSSKGDPVICTVFPPVNSEMLTIAVNRVAMAIVREHQSRGGVLLHGALAARPLFLSENDSGEKAVKAVLLVGPGNAGKTTASNRLPLPWRALSDDAALVLRDRHGQYWAHPWPTWSRFYSSNGNPGPGGSWNVQQAVPLSAVFFLSQSSRDRVEPFQPTDTMALLMDAAQQVGKSMIFYMQDDEIRAIYQEQLNAVEMLARTVPAFTLHISLTGRFWKEIESVLLNRKTKQKQFNSRFDKRLSIPGEKQIFKRSDNDVSYMVYTGPSMNPILREPDLLKLQPYKDRFVKCGDVICFKAPENGRLIVHRVIRVDSKGIRTRGDNNTRTDPYLLQPGDIIGQVVWAQKDSRHRRIYGSTTGVLTGYYCQSRRLISRPILRSLHGLYRAMANTGLFRLLLPSRLFPRVYVFRSGQLCIVKCLLGRRVIGKYDNRKGIWQIDRPYRLFLREAALPQPGLEFSQELRPKA